MSNNQQAYQRTLFDDARYQLEGSVQSGAKWPANLAIKPHVEEYRGYTQTYARFVVRTNIEGDRNNGIIEAKVPIKTWYALGEQLQMLTGEDFKFDPIECYERPFGKDKRPAKEDTLVARIHTTVREGRISIAVIDARNDQRAKIPFYFGVPNTRCPLTSQGKRDDFMLNKADALAWHRALTDILPAALADMQAKAIKNSTTATSTGGGNSNNGGGSNGNSHHSGGDVDDELPF